MSVSDPLHRPAYQGDLLITALQAQRDTPVLQIGEFINVGSGQEISIAELAALVRDVVYADASDRTCEIVWDDTRPSGTPRKLLDTSRLTALGWQAKKPLADGVRIAYDDYRARL